MKLLVLALFAVVMTSNVAEAKPLKYGFKGETNADRAQEIAAKEGSVDGKSLDEIQPAAGSVQEELHESSTIKRQFKNR